MNHRIAFATCHRLNGLTTDDSLLLKPLKNRKIIVDAVEWDTGEKDWRDYTAVLLRSTWDYHVRLQVFLNWITYLEKNGISVWNPAAVLRANVNKRYLFDLQNAGTLIVPTIWFPQKSEVNLYDVLKSQEWHTAIVKPDVSASAFRTWVVTEQTAAELQGGVNLILNESGVLIQEFRNEVQETGEWSLIFFQREFSHAVLKHPAPGDFRVQEEVGGIIKPAQPSEHVLQQAIEILNKIDGSLLYARVDGIVENDRFLLMEVELIEPSLYLGFAPSSVERFADCIEKVVIL